MVTKFETETMPQKGKYLRQILRDEAKKRAKEKHTIVIKPADIRLLEIPIIGAAPYVQHKFSAKAKAEMIAIHEGGSTAKKPKRTKRDFDAEWAEATHVSTEGWFGIPSMSFRAAAIRACKLRGFEMVTAKCCIFIVADGYDNEGSPLTRIYGKRDKIMSYVRNSGKTTDLRQRPIWHEWEATVTVEYDYDMFRPDDIVNLVHCAGRQVGIGEGRALSPSSLTGMGWGFYRVATVEDAMPEAAE